MTILHVDENHPHLIEALSQSGFKNDTDFESSKTEIERKIEHYQGLIIRSRFPIDAAFLSKAKNLKFIGRVGAGVENIDLKAAKEHGINVFSAAEGNANAVGEHALGMLLNLTNKLRQSHQSIQEGNWLRETHRGEELEKKTIGIIGYGTMGKSFAKKLKGFDVKEILFFDIEEKSPDGYARQVSLSELQEKADVISLHTPETHLTKKMIDAPFFEQMKKPFWLINTARGSAVVTKSLVQALKDGKVKGAALDVLEYEKSSFEHLFGNEIPADFNYLLNSDNVLLSPHVAGWTVESHFKLADRIVAQITATFKSQ